MSGPGANSPGVLARIASERAEDAARAKKSRPEGSLFRAASAPRPLFRAERDFVLIAECKRASPSRGLMVELYDPARIAAAYERGGASGVSVLTEPRHFLGSDADLQAVRAATKLPVLRKDFLVDAYQVREAWAVGADAVLLIAAILDEALIVELAEAAHGLGLEVLLEIHGEDELKIAERAAAAGLADAVGVNSRDLSSFAVDHERSSRFASRLADRLPPGVRRVAESGLASGAEAAALAALGYDAFLVGEHFVTAADPEEAVRRFAERIGSRNAAEGLHTLTSPARRGETVSPRASAADMAADMAADAATDTPGPRTGLAGEFQGGPECARK
jgi:indole-3-glycerol phosphate synthase